MQPFLDPAPAGFGSIAAIAAVVAASSELVEVALFGEEGKEGEGWFVRRNTELSRPEDVMLRSVYAKGFPARDKDGADDAEKAVIKAEEAELQVKLESWAKSLGVGTVKSLRMRREALPAPAGAARPIDRKGRGRFKVSTVPATFV